MILPAAAPQSRSLFTVAQFGSRQNSRRRGLGPSALTLRHHTSQRQPEPWPEPDELARASSERLRALILARVAEAGGALSFRDFMQLALYAPGLGYYSGGSHKFGAGGDFVTAPEVSPLFGRTLARAVAPAIRALSKAEVLEVGAGSGALAAEVLSGLAALDALPARYSILDVSAQLRARQREYLQSRVGALSERVAWLDDFPAAGFSGVVIANELFDAMPVQRLCITETGPVELFVSASEDGFAWQERAVTDTRLLARLDAIANAVGHELAPGYCSEINFAAEDWLRSFAERLNRGLVLAFDYGYPRAEYYHPQRVGGTLMCHYRHRAHDDPFQWVGLQDITAHVDFTGLAEAAHAAGLAVAGYTTQAHFLLGSGLMEEAAALMAGSTEAQLHVANQIKRLTLPQEMGESFKVMALTRGLELSLPGFATRDLCHTL